MPPDESPQDSSARPVDQLKEGDAAEAKEETWSEGGKMVQNQHLGNLPKSPPRLDIKLTGPILTLLSSSVVMQSLLSLNF